MRALLRELDELELAFRVLGDHLIPWSEFPRGCSARAAGLDFRRWWIDDGGVIHPATAFDVSHDCEHPDLDPCPGRPEDRT